MDRSKQKTSIDYKPYNVINTVIEFIDNSSSRIDACVDYTRPSLIVEIAALKKAFVDAKERGIKLRYVTEITTDNVSYCKELINTPLPLFITKENQHLTSYIAMSRKSWTISSMYLRAFGLEQYQHNSV